MRNGDMNIKSILGVFCVYAFTLGMVSSANAALFQSDMIPNSGDGLLTIDTTTNLEWLDLTETANLSFIEVSGGVGDYTTTLGFRYATLEEVTNLYLAAGVTEFGLDQVPSNIPAAELLLDLMGCLEVCSGTLFGAAGLTSTSISTITHSLPFFQLNTTVGARFWVGVNGVTDSSSDASRGSYLVRSVVPVPAAVWLFGSGLLGLIGFARRKSN